MSKSIRISDELAESAEAAAAVSHRSQPQQIEHWAQIGKVLEPILSYELETAVKKVGRPELDEILETVGTPEATARARSVIRRTSGKIASDDS